MRRFYGQDFIPAWRYDTRTTKVAHEHIYWDQATVLVQIGLLDAEKLPVTGAEQTTRLLGLTRR